MSDFSSHFEQQYLRCRVWVWRGARQWTPDTIFTPSSVPVILEIEGHPGEEACRAEEAVLHGVMW